MKTIISMTNYRRFELILWGKPNCNYKAEKYYARPALIQYCMNELDLVFAQKNFMQNRTN
jgi:hypothetical protein